MKGAIMTNLTSKGEDGMEQLEVCKQKVLTIHPSAIEWSRYWPMEYAIKLGGQTTDELISGWHISVLAAWEDAAKAAQPEPSQPAEPALGELCLHEDCDSNHICFHPLGHAGACFFSNEPPSQPKLEERGLPPLDVTRVDRTAAVLMLYPSCEAMADAALVNEYAARFCRERQLAAEIKTSKGLRNELALVDEALARRPAVTDMPNRYTKISAAFNMASRTDKAEAMEKHWKFHFEKAESELTTLHASLETVTRQRDQAHQQVILWQTGAKRLDAKGNTTWDGKDGKLGSEK